MAVLPKGTIKALPNFTVSTNEAEVEDYCNYKISRDNDSNLFEISAVGGSTLPIHLQQRFTQRKYAREAIDDYIKQQETKHTVANSTSAGSAHE